MKIVKIITLSLFVSACGITPQGDMIREFLKQRTQKAADQTAKNARDYLCMYARVGSIKNLFPHPIDRQAYLRICEDPVPLIPTPKLDKTDVENVGI